MLLVAQRDERVQDFNAEHVLWIESGDPLQLLSHERNVPAALEDANDAVCGGPDDIEVHRSGFVLMVSSSSLC